MHRGSPGLPPFDGEVKLALRGCSAVEQLALCSFVLLPPFAAPPLRGGWCPGWGAAPPGGRGLDTTEPPRSTLRTIQGGRKEAEGQMQAEQPRSPSRVDSPALGGSPGRRRSAATRSRQGNEAAL